MSISKWPQHTTTDSQVNNCSMCALWTWTTASNRGRHWSTVIIRQQVRLLASVLVIHCTELQDIPVNCSIFWNFCWTQGYLTWQHISSATCLIFCSVLTVLGRLLPAFREIEFVVSVLRRRSLTELTAHFLLWNSLQIRFAPHPFSWRSNLTDNVSSSWNRTFINKLWRNNDVTLCFLQSCVASFIGFQLTLLKIFEQNLHIYHRNDSTSVCIIHFNYMLMYEDV